MDKIFNLGTSHQKFRQVWKSCRSLPKCLLNYSPNVRTKSFPQTKHLADKSFPNLGSFESLIIYIFFLIMLFLFTSICWASFKNLEDQWFHIYLKKVMVCQIATEIWQLLSCCAMMWLTQNARRRVLLNDRSQASQTNCLEAACLLTEEQQREC